MRQSSLRPFYVIAVATVLLALVRIGFGQTAGDADLNEAYRALASKDYEGAIALFRKGLAAGAGKAAVHKDLAYTLLKTGENEEARDEFEAALRLDPADETAALEFAFLAYETKKPIEARRTFDKLRSSKNPQTRTTAEKAFENIDRPLAEGISRWKEALARAAQPNDLSMYSAHWELAQLAELRDDARLAAEQYGICRQLKPQLSELLLVLARVWKQANRIEESNAALLAASRSKNSRTAELAGEQWGTRYPYPYEFLAALKLDERNTDLRRELAYLYLAMHKDEEAKQQFKRVLEIDPSDQQASSQLSALYGFNKRVVAPDPAVDPVAMGKKSLALGYSRDAVKYLRQAQEEHPNDAELMLDLGYAYNLAKDDAAAIPWFDRARHAEDSLIAAEANKAFHNLRGDTLPQTTVWMLPLYSTRWHDLFGYGQIKRTLPLPDWAHLLSLYLSTRFMGDLKSSMSNTVVAPQYLSESSFIVGAGVSTKTWHHITGWAEAGEAIQYLPFRRDVGKATPDYRGGLNFAKGFGTTLNASHSGWFYETTGDAVYISRFDKDWLFYSQHRAGRTLHLDSGLNAQMLFNVNFTHDVKNQYWANTVEMGPGFKVHLPFMPPNAYLSADLLRGVYTNNEFNPRRPNYNDLRIGLWYAFSR